MVFVHTVNEFISEQGACYRKETKKMRKLWHWWHGRVVFFALYSSNDANACCFMFLRWYSNVYLRTSGDPIIHTTQRMLNLLLGILIYSFNTPANWKSPEAEVASRRPFPPLWPWQQHVSTDDLEQWKRRASDNGNTKPDEQ